jgi:hypothetical protein
MTNKLDNTPPADEAAHLGSRALFRGLFFLVVIAVGAALLVPLGLRADHTVMKVFGH